MNILKSLIKYKFLCLVFVIILISGYSSRLVASKATPSGIDKHTALLLIDIQNFYFPEGIIPLKNSDLASRKAKIILDFFRKRQLPVIHVKHMPGDKSSPKADEDPGWAIHAQVAPKSGERVIEKHYVNCFRETELLDFLRNRKIRNLVICGMQTHMCLEAGVRAAADYGFSVQLIQDACATRDLVLDDIRIPAHLVHASTLATLKSAYAKILSADEFITNQCGVVNPSD
jgi:nicotinamidase-related amidase